jgi:hypothetical protein
VSGRHRFQAAVERIRHLAEQLVGNGRLRRLLIVLMLADTGSAVVMTRVRLWATSRAMAQKNT